jgi:hypothetical protein
VKLPPTSEDLLEEDDAPPLQDVLRAAYESGAIQQEMKTCHKELAAGKVPQFMRTNRIEPSDCTFVKGMLMVDGRLYIPDYLNLRTKCT